MKQLLAILAILVVGYAAPASAQVICEDCRNPRFFPQDWINAGYNNFIGDQSFLTGEQADSYYMVNTRGHQVEVDTNASYTGTTIDLSLGLSTFFLQIGIDLASLVIWPDDLLVQVIITRDYDGEQFQETFSVNEHPNGGLRVGRKGPRRARGGGGGGGGGAGGGHSGPPSPGIPNSGRVCGNTSVDGGKRRRTCI